MKFSSALAIAFLALGIDPSIAADPRSIPIVLDQKDGPNLRRDKECPDGFQGNNCAQNVNECQAFPYPCTGGNKLGSYCVDYDPPKKFKCGCRSGYDAVLPNVIDVKDNVPLEWRPLLCRPKDVCVGFECHEDATCIVSSINKPVCVCNDDLIGDGVTNCSSPPKKLATRQPTPQLKTRSCKVESDCDKIANSVCREGVCKCKAGYFQINGKGNCFNENECRNGFPNDCHKNAICKDTEGSYTCTCKDGYQDLNSQVKPGTICTQINECLDPSMNNCNTETQVCLDRSPPLKWECVQRTPAPTPAPTPKPTPKPAAKPTPMPTPMPTPECVNDASCGGDSPVCFNGSCVFCINDNLPDGDTGCGNSGDCAYSECGEDIPLELNEVGNYCDTGGE